MLILKASALQMRMDRGRRSLKILPVCSAFTPSSVRILPALNALKGQNCIA